MTDAILMTTFFLKAESAMLYFRKLNDLQLSPERGLLPKPNCMWPVKRKWDSQTFLAKSSITKVSRGYSFQKLSNRANLRFITISTWISWLKIHIFTLFPETGNWWAHSHLDLSRSGERFQLMLLHFLACSTTPKLSCCYALCQTFARGREEKILLPAEVPL